MQSESSYCIFYVKTFWQSFYNLFQIELTRTLIKDQFIHLYEKKGLDKVTVNEICKVCEISRSTFYQHFDDKYDFLETIENELLDNVQNLNKDMQEIFIRDTKASIPNWTETATYIMEKKDPEHSGSWTSTI